jgi:histidinol-phosphate aminotransferase
MADASAFVHGGADAQAAAQHDFSTNTNACGPCPSVHAAVVQSDATRYPDPAYTALRERLAAFHGTTPQRIVLAGSGSEFIHRITAVAAALGALAVALPAHSYGDYALAAQARGLQRLRPTDPGYATAGLQWACEPSSPLGRSDPALLSWPAVGLEPEPQHAVIRVIDCAYAPLRLDTAKPAPILPANAWQLWTPNKAMGLTGVRAAYALAPAGTRPEILALFRAHAPSWPVGAHGVAMLNAWGDPVAQQWLAESLRTLSAWKAEQARACETLRWQVLSGSLANYFVARISDGEVAGLLTSLRASGIQLRNCASFGLPGHVRLGVLAPDAQQALVRAMRGLCSPIPG